MVETRRRVKVLCFVRDICIEVVNTVGVHFLRQTDRKFMFKDAYFIHKFMCNVALDFNLLFFSWSRLNDYLTHDVYSCIEDFRKLCSSYLRTRCALTGILNSTEKVKHCLAVATFAKIIESKCFKCVLGSACEKILAAREWT